MKNKIFNSRLAIGAIVTVLAFSACKKDTPEIVPAPPGSAFTTRFNCCSANRNGT